ncbi:hypothetical protein ACQ4PT_047771 [Festuca glaucescens]
MGNDFAIDFDGSKHGFVSLDCGGKTGDYRDETGIQWISDSGFISSGQVATLPPQTHQVQMQFRSLRYFPLDGKKYCYSIAVRERARYLVRASFFYGSFDSSPVYPKFRVSLGTSPWSTVVIDDPSLVEAEEAIVLTRTPEISVCLSDASMGQPFISTLELRMFSGSMYSTPYKADFFLGLSARINFGAESNESIRYPDAPFDRIWKSDLLGPLEMAGGARRVSSVRQVSVGKQEEPPQRVMRTAVVGQRGFLSYEVIFEQSAGNSWIATYFAEIEDLAPTETRNFTVEVSDWPQYSGLTVDVAAEAGGKYRLYEQRFINVSVDHLLFMKLRKRNDFSKGPIINAMEIYKYLPISADHSNHATGRRRAIIIAACTAAGVVLLIVIAIGCCCYFRRKKNPPDAPEEEFGLIQAATGRYTLSDIQEATNGFEDISDSMNEISLLSRIHHRNLVSFLGYGQQSEKSILVYEFMHNETLKHHLPGKSPVPELITSNFAARKEEVVVYWFANTP